MLMGGPYHDGRNATAAFRDVARAVAPGFPSAMTVPVDPHPPRRHWMLPRSALWLGLALLAATLLTAGALVAAS
jgi:hypothetical protein